MKKIYEDPLFEITRFSFEEILQDDDSDDSGIIPNSVPDPPIGGDGSDW